MRNLKRALSLALAAAMLIGMMVVGASASYKDEDSISKAEAVQLLTDLGVVGGVDGNFNPQKTLTRAEFAVMMANLLTGCKFDATLFDGAQTPFTDIEGHWAAPYIAYCYSAGVIAGTGDGTTYSPNKTLTTAQAAAILLSALGYNRNGEFAVNNQFELNVTSIAQKAGLYEDLSSLANAAVTRENVAQMLKNALFLNTKEYLAVLQIYQDNASLASSLFNGLTKATATLTTVTSGKISTVTMTKGLDLDDDSTIDSITGLTNLAASSADIGKTITVYVDKTNKLLSTATVVTDKGGVVVPDNLTSGTATKAGSSAKFLKDNGFDETDTTTIDSITVNQFNATGAVTTWKTAQSSYTVEVALQSVDNGDIVTIYDTNKDGKVDIINIISKTVAKVGAAPVVKIDKADDNKEKVSITGLAGISNIETKKVNGYEGLAKDDIVLFYKDGEGNFYIEKAATATGTVTGSKAGKVLLNGTYYDQSDLASCSAAGTSVSTYLSNGKFNVAATAYLDNNGNIIAIDNDVAVATNYAVVLKTAWVSEQGVDAGSDKLEAKLLLADGTTTTVVISKIGGDKVAKTGSTIDSETASDGANTTSANSVKYYGVTDSATTGNIDSTIFKYLVKDSKYELTAATGSNTTAASGTITNKGVPALSNGDVANVNTIYVYHTKDTSDKDVFTVYTGYANAPKTTNTNIASAVNNGFAAFVYVDATGSTATTGTTNNKNYAYVLDTAISERYVGEDTIYDITAALNGGVSGTISTKDGSLANMISSGSAVKGLFQVTLDDDGYVTAATVVTKAGNWVAVAGTDQANGAPANGVLKVDGTNSGSYTYDGTEKVYIVDETNGTIYEGTIANVQDDDYVFVEVVNASGTDAEKVAIKTIYVKG